MSVPLRAMVSLGLVTILTGCGLKQSIAAGGKAVDVFHQKFNDQKFSEIYSSATPAFKTSMKEADFIKFEQAVHRKLGPFKSASRTGWRGNSTPTSTTVVLTYNSQFEKHPAVETFTFIVSGETATLQGYNINSSALVTE